MTSATSFDIRKINDPGKWITRSNVDFQAFPHAEHPQNYALCNLTSWLSSACQLVKSQVSFLRLLAFLVTLVKSHLLWSDKCIVMMQILASNQIFKDVLEYSEQ